MHANYKIKKKVWKSNEKNLIRLTMDQNRPHRWHRVIRQASIRFSHCDTIDDYALSTNERYIIFVRFNQQSYVLKHAMPFIGRNLYSWYSLESGEYCVQFTHKSHDTLCENLNKMEFTAFWLVGWMVVVSFAVIPMMAYAINQAK